MDEVLVKLKNQLQMLEWPNVYLFKFIVPNESELVAQTMALFDDTSEIVVHPSKNNKYASISVKELMLNVDSIIEKYNKASKIKGIISL
jgi:putative lipoic acid-binding regulatory protein